MRTIKRYLLKMLVGVVIGAMLGALLGGVAGNNWAVGAIFGACVGLVGASLYDPRAVVHSSPTSRRDTSPYNRGD